ncbi:hypothetical protein FQN49_006324 [Arthroderma sp. PD_2]|nr:hypothetical protein FQN49_006324 [Arthroderma sp. PD_2]
MFHIGNSHKCEPCRKSNDLHEKRHKEIASLIEQIHDIDRGEGARTMKFTGRVGVLEPTNPILTPGRHVIKDGRAVIRRGVSDARQPLQRTQSVKDRRAEKKAMKLEKSMAKTVKRQASRPFVPGIVLASSVEQVGKAIHGTSQLESTIGPQDADAFFVSCIRRFEDLEQQAQELAVKQETGVAGSKDSKVRERGDYSSVNKVELPMIREILAELDIRINHKGSDKDRKALLIKVADAIFLDITLVSKEARETMRRSAGYWRFVNKRTYNAMVRNSKIVNWETGEKLPEVGKSPSSLNAEPDTDPEAQVDPEIAEPPEAEKKPTAK